LSYAADLVSFLMRLQATGTGQAAEGNRENRVACRQILPTKALSERDCQRAGPIGATVSRRQAFESCQLSEHCARGIETAADRSGCG
jgi:hypothetical protein